MRSRGCDPDQAGHLILAKFYQEQRQILARRMDEDPITPRVDAVVKEIEAICRPVISEWARGKRTAGNRTA